MRTILRLAAGAALLLLVLLAGTIAFSHPTAPPPLASIASPYRQVDFSDLPPLQHFIARDGTTLAYRRYPGDPNRAVILIHGSAGSSISMHATAKALAAAGATVVAPDLRGHGASGPHGDIAYIGQLEDDLQDLLDTLDRAHHPDQTRLIGFSSGGGFALRIAGSRLAPRFSRTILLAPYLRYNAPNAPTTSGTTSSTTSGGWVSLALPRLIALTLLNNLGITALNFLPVIAFAIPPGNPNHLTATYSFRLLLNFQPDDDYLADLRRTTRPIMAIDGTNDELFRSDRLQAALAEGRPGIRVDLVPGVGHIGLTTTPSGTAAIVKAWSGTF